MSDSSSEITHILVQLEREEIGRREGTDRIFELAHEELRRLALDLMRHERQGQTLQPTAIVHEVYMRLVDNSRVQWESRAHFFGIAARAMRHILIDEARKRATAKHGGGLERMTLDPNLQLEIAPEVKLLRLEEILGELEEMDERMSKIVELRVFGGLRNKEIAHVLEVSERTVDNDWNVAKMWITRALVDEGTP